MVLSEGANGIVYGSYPKCIECIQSVNRSYTKSIDCIQSELKCIEGGIDNRKSIDRIQSVLKVKRCVQSEGSQ